MTTTAPPVPRIDPHADVRQALDDCIATFRRHLHYPDPGALLVTLAAVVANRADGDPVWLLLVGPPGGGKTETLGGIVGLADVHPAATITEAALLSGTPKKETAEDARGGLLRAIGTFGLVVCKDFGSVLSMNRDARASLMAALREIYDGSWTRHVGTDGGRTLHWEGKVGLIAGCTPSIDSHHAVMGAMGERFIQYRLPPIDGDALAARALSHLGSERTMRAEMAAAVRRVIDTVDPADMATSPTEETSAWLVRTATLAVRCRSSVERDSYSREVELIPEAEAPGRLALVLLRIFNALRALGVESAEARRLVAKCALDSMPAVRRAVLEAVIAAGGEPTTTTVAETIGYPTTTARRACEDLAAHGVLERRPGGQGKPDRWIVTPWTRQRWGVPEKSAEMSGVPEKSDHAPRTVPETSGEAGSAAQTVPETLEGESSERRSGPFTLSLCMDDDKTGTVPAPCVACGKPTEDLTADGDPWCLACWGAA